MKKSLSSRIYGLNQRKVCIFLLSGFFLVPVMPVSAAPEKSAPEIVLTVRDGSRKIALHRTIQIDIEGLAKWHRLKNSDPSKFVLNVDGNDLKGISPVLVNNGSGLQFDLRRIKDQNENVWDSILSRRHRGFTFERPVLVTVSHDDVTVEGSYRAGLVIVQQNWLYFFIVIFLLAIAIFIWLAVKSDILRVPGAQPAGLNRKGRPNQKRYSLARTQMALWFFTIIISYVFIWMVTDDLTCVTMSVLGLMGISALTGLGSAAVDSTKLGEQQGLKHSFEEEKRAAEVEVEKLQSRMNTLEIKDKKIGIAEIRSQQLALSGNLAVAQKEMEQAGEKIGKLGEAITPPVSRHFLIDILSDDSGLSFHRFQMFAWTIVLIVIFMFQVYRDLTMPDFDATLLALMGISGGTYLGFKLPQRQG